MVLIPSRCVSFTSSVHEFGSFLGSLDLFRSGLWRSPHVVMVSLWGRSDFSSKHNWNFGLGVCKATKPQCRRANSVFRIDSKIRFVVRWMWGSLSSKELAVMFRMGCWNVNLIHVGSRFINHFSKRQFDWLVGLVSCSFWFDQLFRFFTHKFLFAI